jgi:GT2 family glycosyltransferase/glycosyltransferase involved in cell wall biosynthesis
MKAAITPIRPMPGLDARPVQLHVIHDLGGGTAKWLVDFSTADSERTNLVLKALTHEQAMGTGMALYANVADEMPLRVWKFKSAIAATVTAHPEYRRVLDEIVRDYHVDVVLVSSLIGHSLEVLETGLPTVVVTHDYYPYCPAINIYFDGVCRQCDGTRIGECYRENLKFNPFVTFAPAERVQVRERFMDLVRRPSVIMATPSQSVADNLIRLNDLFREVSFRVIPHGYGHALSKVATAEHSPDERLRILVMGQLSQLKGAELLRGSLTALNKFADIWLLGAREVGESFQFKPGVHVESEYEMADLPKHVANVNPHVALLMSIAPETFNYTLSELMMLGVPVAATRVGSFPERIRHLENGYLFEPDVPSLVGALGAINADRATLARIKQSLAGWKPRTAEEMVSDYHRITPVETPSGSRDPSRRTAPEDGERSSAPTNEAFVAQAMTLSSMWKDLKSLHLQLTVANGARQHEQGLLHLKTHELAEARKEILEQEALLLEKDGQIQALTSHLEMKSAQVAAFLSSTSWRVSSPVRLVGHTIRRLKTLGIYVEWLFDDPASLPKNIGKLTKSWRSDGMRGLKRALQDLQSEKSREHAWDRYGRTFRKEVRPRIIGGVVEMSSRPLISVIVATFNPNEHMLRQMLNSVRGQLYPNWELCVADDGSSEPHVERVLKEYAAADRRIKLRFERENKGVSHALNRALEMVSGDFVVLLDHDDLLEEQALFRFARCILEDDPDMFYADEAFVEADASVLRRFAFRPAFSLEFLRSHPYIVHPVGFRTKLLRDIGGFDETLNISQDYDLILRAAEKSRTIVHIPEVLYRWRVHGGSSGILKMSKVMETSTAVLQRHLERCGEVGTVGDGPSFNLFDTRYPLGEGLKVAIIIPTKNHGELLRQCIDSIWATVTGIPYDIVVVDHESDDPVTRSYFELLPEAVRVLRYEGVFNFSAINNWAVSQVAGPYSHYLFCNNDIEAIEPGWLERMLELGQQSSIGIVGAKLLYPDRETIQHAGVCVGAYGAAEHYGKRVRHASEVEQGYAELLTINREVAAVTAACMLIRREAFEEIGGFDESIAVGFGDVDLCLRVGQRGYRVVFCPYAQLVHHESYTRGTSNPNRDPHPEDSALYHSKWKQLLQAGDPFYNPGFSLTSTSWAYRLPLNCSYQIRRRIVHRDLKSGRETHSFSAAS